MWRYIAMPLKMPLILKESFEIIALEDIVSSYTKQMPRWHIYLYLLITVVPSRAALIGFCSQ